MMSGDIKCLFICPFLYLTKIVEVTEVTGSGYKLCILFACASVTNIMLNLTLK
jgi:hypothetical protein